MTAIFKSFIPGRPVSKKNTKKVVRRYGRVLVIYSRQFLAWESVALPVLKRDFAGRQTIDKALEINLVFHFKDKRREPDVSNLVEAPQDALTKAGVIIDDRIIQVVKASKVFDGTEGTDVELYLVGD